jgi:hypothetical protein
MFAVGESSLAFAFDVDREIIRRLKRGFIPQAQGKAEGIEPGPEVGGCGRDFDENFHDSIARLQGCPGLGTPPSAALDQQ